MCVSDRCAMRVTLADVAVVADMVSSSERATSARSRASVIEDAQVSATTPAHHFGNHDSRGVHERTLGSGAKLAAASRPPACPFRSMRLKKAGAPGVVEAHIRVPGCPCQRGPSSQELKTGLTRSSDLGLTEPQQKGSPPSSVMAPRGRAYTRTARCPGSLRGAPSRP